MPGMRMMQWMMPAPWLRAGCTASPDLTYRLQGSFGAETMGTMLMYLSVGGDGFDARTPERDVGVTQFSLWVR